MFFCYFGHLVWPLENWSGPILKLVSRPETEGVKNEKNAKLGCLYLWATEEWARKSGVNNKWEY